MINKFNLIFFLTLSFLLSEDLFKYFKNNSKNSIIELETNNLDVITFINELNLDNNSKLDIPSYSTFYQIHDGYDIQVSLNGNKRLLGLFAEKALPKVHDGRTPTTTEMAKLAIERLDDDPNGFFIMIEESQVDWGGHANSAEYIQGEMQSLNDLINHVLDYQASHPDVLVVLTADHECGGVAVHDGEKSTLDIRFTSDYHSANFVPIWATGPGAEVFDAFMDNTEIGKQLISYVMER